MDKPCTTNQPPPVPRRIRILGTSGSGKTTLAAQVAARIGVVHIELDEVFWDEGWQHKERDVAREILRTRITAAEVGGGWVADGSWWSKTSGLLANADTIVCLDLPRRIVMWQVIMRTLKRGATRRELWHGNRESLTRLASRDPETNIILWSWQTWATNRARWDELEAEGAPVLRLRSRREVREWFEALPSAETP